MKKLIFSAVLLLIFSMLLVGCVPQEEPAPEEPPIAEEPAPEVHVHSFGSWKVTKATCTKPGKRVRACSCGESESEVLPATGHKIGGWTVEDAPDCLNGGDRYRACTTCRVELEREELDALGHDFVATKVYPNVELEGYTVHICSRCTYSYDDEFVPAWGQVQFRYAVNPDGETCTIMGVVLNETRELHIPEVVSDFGEEYRVTAIGAHAFDGCDTLSLIRVPDGVTVIDNFAFANCTALTEIYLPDGVTVIGDSAFEGCVKLLEIELPESVSVIGSAAFRGCKILTEIALPDAVTELSDYLFAGCLALSKVEFGEVTRVGECAFFGCAFIESLPSLDFVTEIGDGAFFSCIGLTEIKFGDALTLIGKVAFFNTPALERVEIPSLDVWFGLELLSSDANPLHGGASLFVGEDAVTEIVVPESVSSIGDYLFFGCADIVSAVIPDTVTYVGESVFTGCCALESVELLASIERLPSYLFNGCTSLVSLILPEGITHVGISALEGCESLAELVIPESVYYIAKSAFADCKSLTEILIPDGVEFIYADTFKGCESLRSVALPSALTYIESAAFAGCASLEVLELPEGLVSIGEEAFLDCSSIREIRIPESLASIGYSAFGGCTSTVKIFVETLESWCAIDFANVEANPLSVSRNEYDEEGFLVKEAAKIFIGGFYARDLVVPADIPVISDYAFWHCEGIMTVCFLGTAEELASLEIADSLIFRERAENGSLYLYSYSRPDDIGKYWYYNNYGYICKW
jgi:hypothetical protein